MEKGKNLFYFLGSMEKFTENIDLLTIDITNEFQSISQIMDEILFQLYKDVDDNTGYYGKKLILKGNTTPNYFEDAFKVYFISAQRKFLNEKNLVLNFHSLHKNISEKQISNLLDSFYWYFLYVEEFSFITKNIKINLSLEILVMYRKYTSKILNEASLFQEKLLVIKNRLQDID